MLNNSNLGISPIIGVLLIVALVVSLVTILTFVVFDIGNNNSENIDATVQLNEHDNGATVTLVRNQNIDNFRVEGPNGEVKIIDSIGNSVDIEDGNGTYTVIAEFNDGQEQVLQSKNIVTQPSIRTGEISFNPPAEGVKIESIDSDGNIIDYDVTNKYGDYTIEEGESIKINEEYELYEQESENINLSSVSSDLEEDIPTILMDGDGTESNPYKVRYASDLQAIDEKLNGHYEINNDIDANHTYEWNSNKGFNPIGSFTGNLNGNNYEINNINIDRVTEEGVGLIEENNGHVKNLQLKNAEISGNNFVGGIAGLNNNGQIENSSIDGNIIADNNIGGLVGQNEDSGTISNSFAKGTITGESFVGGLVGNNIFQAEVNNSFANGTVTGENKVGGFAGYNEAEINTSYSISEVIGEGDEVNGFVGTNAELMGAVVENSYWDIEKINQDDSIYSTSLETDEMIGDNVKDNMTGFDFENDWSTIENDYPKLQWQE